MSDRCTPIWAPRQSAAVGLGCIFVGALGALLLGQDGGFDLKNYHHYNAWAFIGGRFGHDFVVAQQQTWLNPALDLHYYLSLLALGPALGSALVGAVQGVALWLLFELAGRALPGEAEGWSHTQRMFMALVVVAVGGFGPIAWVNLGASRGDLTVSIFVLASLLLLLDLPEFAPQWRPIHAHPRRLVLASGVLMGLGCGLKLTVAAFAVGGLVALGLSSSGSLGSRAGVAIRWAGGCLLGILVSAGPWMAVLWTNYRSPIFPFANHVIRSPYSPQTSFAEVRFRPDGLAEVLSFPLQFASGAEVAWEFAFRDVRLGILYLLVLAFIGRAVWTVRVAAGAWRGPRSLRLLLPFSVVSYVVWQGAFCVYRYLAPLEMLAPLLIVLILGSMLRRPAHAQIASALALALIVVAVQMPLVERLPWATDIFAVQLPAPVLDDDAVVVLAGDDATSYLATYFPPQVRFLRIAGNFAAADEDTQMHRDMAAVLDSAIGGLHFLKGPYEIDHQALAHFGLVLRSTTCKPVLSRVDRNLALCALDRLDPE